jgi:hypothetical protein
MLVQQTVQSTEQNYYETTIRTVTELLERYTVILTMVMYSTITMNVN